MQSGSESSPMKIYAGSLCAHFYSCRNRDPETSLLQPSSSQVCLLLPSPLIPASAKPMTNSCAPAPQHWPLPVYLPRRIFPLIVAWLPPLQKCPLKCHLLREAFPDHSLCNNKPHPAPSLALICFVLSPSLYHLLTECTHSHTHLPACLSQHCPTELSTLMEMPTAEWSKR